MVQIDMEMPATCWECPFGLPRLTGNHFVICMVPGCNRLMTAQDAKEKRAKNCPLIDTGEEFEWCHDCKEYDQEAHCCHRWTKVIRNTVEELRRERPKGKWTLNADHSATCSVCGHTQLNAWDVDNSDNFCHFCGADMREVEHETD